MGSYAALALVRRHPDRLRALALCSGRAGADSEEGRRNRALMAEKVLREGAVVAADAMGPRLLGKSTREQRPDVVARVREMILANPPRGIADALAGLAARADSTATLREVRVPTLVLCGDEDELITPDEGRRLQAGIAGSRLEVVARAGHLPNLEDPAAFDAALGRFLAALG
jgi:3-oxoadipate enol-lactonase